MSYNVTVMQMLFKFTFRPMFPPSQGQNSEGGPPPPLSSPSRLLALIHAAPRCLCKADTTGCCSGKTPSRDCKPVNRLWPPVLVAQYTT